MLAQLQNYLSEQLNSEAIIAEARPLSGGASRDTWYLRVTTEGDNYAFVMRRDLPTQMFEDALTREQEYRLMDAAYQSGVQVAQVRYLCTDEAVLGSPFFIMDYVAGISIGRKVISSPALNAARAALPPQMAQQLAQIHAIDLEAHGIDFLPQPDPSQSAHEQTIEQVYAILDALEIHSPIWEWTLRWAQSHKPNPNPLGFVHGDFRIGNLLVDEQGLTAVIDWEFGHIGDPDEEIGYLCMRDWRFGNGQQRAAGLTDRESFLQAYEAASGRAVSRESVDWWELMGNIRWGVICMSQANRHLSGEEPSVELASLGRRSAEMQLEALRLIEQFGGI